MGWRNGRCRLEHDESDTMIQHTLQMRREQMDGNIVPLFRIDFSVFDLNEMAAQQIYRAISDILDGVSK